MIIDKFANMRYLVLDRCFSDFKHKFTYKELTEKVSEALFSNSPYKLHHLSVRGDIKYLREKPAYNAPIEAYSMEDGKSHYFRYSNPNFRLFNNTLPFDEIKILCSTLRKLYLETQTYNKVKYPTAHAFLNEIIINLEDRLEIRKTIEQTPPTDTQAIQAKKFTLQGLDHLATITEAVITRQPLKLHYSTFNEHEFDVTCHPYYVKLHNNRWFLLALTEQYGKLGCYALDKISTLEPTDVPFIMKGNMNIETYFKNVAS